MTAQEFFSFSFKQKCLHGCEAKLVVDSSEFYVCKEQLIAQSEFFHKLWTSGPFLEHKHPSDGVNIEEEIAEDFHAFLCVLIPHPITNDVEGTK